MYRPEAHNLNTAFNAGFSDVQAEFPLSKEDLLSQDVVKKRLSDLQLEWLKVFYDHEAAGPIRQELEAFAHGEGDIAHLRGLISQESEKNIVGLLETLPAFQVGNWSYLKNNWDKTGYRWTLMEMTILQATGKHDLVMDEVHDLSRFAWYSNVGYKESFEQALEAAGAEKPDEQLEVAEDKTESTAEKIKSLKLQVVALRKKAKGLLAPPDYLTQAKVRSAVNKEKGEIHAETWDELMDLAEGALREKNSVRYLAIAQKFAETRNEDKLFVNSRYIKDMSAKQSADGQAHKAGEYFGFSRTALENFRIQILVGTLNMSEQASMRNLADITDIAEKGSHQAIMRLYGSRNGQYYFKSYEDWDGEVRAEKGKLPAAALLSQSSHLGGYEVLPAADFETSGKTIELLQDNQLDYYIKNWNSIRFLATRGQINASQARAAAMPQNAMRILAAAARLPETMTVVRTANGEIEYEKDVDGKGFRKDANGEKIPKQVNLRQEATKVLAESLIRYGEQQISADEWDDNRQALQQLLNEHKIDKRYRTSIAAAQDEGDVDPKYKIFNLDYIN